MDHHPNLNSSSTNNDLTRAAQARRRQRVVMNAPKPPPTTTTTTTPPPSSLPSSSSQNLMNQSMEVGADAASLLASIRKEKKLSYSITSSIPSTTTTNNNNNNNVATSATTTTSTSTTPTTNMETTTTTTPTSYFMSMLLNKKPNDLRNNNTPTTTTTNISNDTTTTTTTGSIDKQYRTTVVAAMSHDTTNTNRHPSTMKQQLLPSKTSKNDSINNNHNLHVQFNTDHIPPPQPLVSSKRLPSYTSKEGMSPLPPPPPQQEPHHDHASTVKSSSGITFAPLSISLPLASLSLSTMMTTLPPQQTIERKDNDTPDISNIPPPIYDASCNTISSYIRIQSHAYPTRTIAVGTNPTIERNDDDDDDDTIPVTATLDGNFLQDSIEVLQMVPINMDPSNHNSHSKHLHYGDTVRLLHVDSTTTRTKRMIRSTKSQPSVLTCSPNNTFQDPMNHNQKNDTTAAAAAAYTIQFIPWKGSSNIGKSQQWTILSSSTSSSSSTCTIKVGRAALEEEALQRLSHYPSPATTHSNNQNHVQQPQNPTRAKIPIRYRDPIVLRNCATGGILSCHTRNSYSTIPMKGSPLQVLTDATFQPHIAMIDSDDDNEPPVPTNHRVTILPQHQTSAMSRLQQSSQLIPSPYEIFSLVPPSLPILPLWMKQHHHQYYCGFDMNQVHHLQPSSPNPTTACYMDMSYLLYPDRFETMDDIARSLFTILGDGNQNNHSQHRNEQTDDMFDDITIQGQEQILLYELISACMGMEGRYIRAVSNPSNDSGSSKQHGSSDGHAMDDIEFRLYDDAQCRWDVIVRRLIEDMLLLPTLFVRIQYFIHQHTPGYEYGHVLQAFCGRLGELVHDYIGTVVLWYQQYHNSTLTLTKFQIQLHSSIHTLSILYQICQVVQSQKGGALINAIRQWQRTSSEGDIESEQIVTSLLEAASVPFMKRLLEWLEVGVLSDDPHSEFMIECSSDPNTSWENKYTLSKGNVLEGFFATEQLVEQALAAGRYWNAIRFCQPHGRNEGVVDQNNGSSTFAVIHYLSNVSSISAFVQTKYRDASRSLLRLLMDEYDLLSILRTMKQYFLLEHGDFFVNFLDCAEEELLKDVTFLSRTRIQHWLDSCRQSLDQGDDESDDHTISKVLMDGLRCRISTDGLADYLDKLHAASGGIDTKDAWTPMRHTYGGTLASTKSELTGLDTFYLDLAAIPFPISTVLSSSAIGCYHLLFRHLFYAKYVERRMVSIWNDHQMMKELKSLRGPMGATFLLRQRMLHLLQNLIYYMMFEVIEPTWLIMEKAISAPTSNAEQTVDDILQHHTQFLQRTLEACLLTNRDVVRALTKLLKTCLLFSEQMKRFMKATKLEEERNAVAIEKQKEVQNDFYSRFTKRTFAKASVKHLQENFSRKRKDRSDRIQRQSARIEREVCSEPFRRMITRFEEVFTKNLKDFMIQINNSDDIYHTHKVNLCIRLDYNGYITSSLGLC